MKKKCLFSVLIANFNGGKFLQDAIDSVLEQTYPNWEVIIVDDGSTDNSIEIYRKYKDDLRFKIFFNDHNYGCGYSKKECVIHANGEICGFLDSDDALLPNAIEDMVSCHCDHKDVSVVFSRYHLYDANWNLIGDSRKLELQSGESYFVHGDYAPEHFVSFKREMYNMTEGINPLYPMAEDQDLFYKLEEVGPCYVLNKFTYKYRYFANSTSHKDALEGPFWNTLVGYEACKRRNISIKEHCLEPWKRYVDDHKGYNSRAYKLGYALLRPLLLFKNKKI